jgi:hypothetical protein
MLALTMSQGFPPTDRLHLEGWVTNPARASAPGTKLALRCDKPATSCHTYKQDSACINNKAARAQAHFLALSIRSRTYVLLQAHKDNISSKAKQSLHISSYKASDKSCSLQKADSY